MRGSENRISPYKATAHDLRSEGLDSTATLKITDLHCFSPVEWRTQPDTAVYG
jgi:hypothetical protein